MRTSSDPTSHPLNLLFPVPPILPDPEPPVIEVSFSYEQLKSYRLQSAAYIVRATYDTVQRIIEDRILERQQEHFFQWLEWVRVSL